MYTKAPRARALVEDNARGRARMFMVGRVGRHALRKFWRTEAPTEGDRVDLGCASGERSLNGVRIA